MPEVRLIDREQAGKNICKYCASNAYCKEDDCMVYQGLRDTPTIQTEAEPVRHGRWIDKGEYAVCTECGGRSGTQYDGLEPIALMARFCQNCGARMDANDTNVGGRGGADNGNG